MAMTSTERSRRHREKRHSAEKTLHQNVAKLSTEIKELRAIVANALQTKSNTSRPRKPRQPQLPLAWQPNEAHFALGLSRGLQRKEVLDLAERYLDWLVNAKRPHKDLDAGFRNFLKNNQRFNRGYANGEIPPTLSELRYQRDREITFRTIVEAEERGRTRH